MNIDDTYYDIDTDKLLRKRHVITDVLKPDDAAKSKKSSKMHKLKPRTKKRDFTKSYDRKLMSMGFKYEVSNKVFMFIGA
jgi:hypothetical protein